MRVLRQAGLTVREIELGEGEKKGHRGPQLCVAYSSEAPRQGTRIVGDMRIHSGTLHPANSVVEKCEDRAWDNETEGGTECHSFSQHGPRSDALNIQQGIQLMYFSCQVLRLALRWHIPFPL